MLRDAGFTVAGAAHAYALLDAYLYGSVLQESALPFNDPDGDSEVTSSIMMGASARTSSPVWRRWR